LRPRVASNREWCLVRPPFDYMHAQLRDLLTTALLDNRARMLAECLQLPLLL
jgi:hypothetical protein